MKLKRVLWAVDAFPDTPELQAQAGRAVRAILHGNSAMVEPVFVTSSPPPGLIINPPSLPSLQLDTARRNLDSLLKLVALPGLLEPRFVHADGSSISGMVEALLEYAMDTDTDLIATGTHARRGMPRWFLGSFAETLLLKSSIPVVVANAKSGFSSRIRHLFFPTDFSEESHRGFVEAIQLAAQLDADILLFHQLQTLSPGFGYPFVVPLVDPESFLELTQQRRHSGHQWESEAISTGVRCKFHLSSKNGDPSKRIASAAEKLPDSAILMVSQSGPVGAAVLGSVTRWVVRVAKRPVLVLHPDRKRRAHRHEGDEESASVPLRRYGLLS